MDNSIKGFITNDWDRDNLNFLLMADSKCMKEWYEQADLDDLVYAQELLDAYAKELQYYAQDVLIEDSLMRTDKFVDAMRVIEKCK